MRNSTKTMRRTIPILLMMCSWFVPTMAQDGNTAYSFLDIPVSAHSAALGGNNVSLIEDDVTLMFSNPALLANVSDNTLNLNFMTYIAGTNKLSAGYAKVLGERSTLGFGVSYLNYGSMTKTTENMEEQGKFSAKDIDVQGSFCYNLTDHWTGAVTAKALFSNYGEFSSVGLGVDLGLNYYDDIRGWSVGIVAQNLGGQVKAFEEDLESMPFNLALGISKDVPNSPFRLSFTFDNLTHWSKDYFYDISGEEESFGKRLIKHVSLGADIFPSSNTWVAIGYSFRRSKEMKVADESAHWAGFSLGAGVSIKKFKLGLGYGKYHVGASSLLVNASFSL